MGNSPSKEGSRKASGSSIAPLASDFATPSTPTPLLASFERDARTFSPRSFSSPLSPTPGGFSSSMSPTSGGFGSPLSPTSGGFSSPLSSTSGGFSSPLSPTSGGFSSPLSPTPGAVPEDWPLPPAPVFLLPGRSNTTVNESGEVNKVNRITTIKFAGGSPTTPRFPPDSNPRTPTHKGQGDFQEISQISQPKPARPHIRRLSELIDPDTITEDHEKPVRSPSGHLLGRHSFEERPDRPLSIRERQERVRHKVMLQRSQTMLREVAAADGGQQRDPEKGEKDGKKSRGCCPCFG